LGGYDRDGILDLKVRLLFLELHFMDAPSESTLMEFILYNNWANQQVLQACQNLSEEQLGAMIPGAYGTIRDTLEHIIQAEAFYVGLLTGNRPQPPFQWQARPSFAEMRDFATQVGNALVDAINQIRPTDRVDQEEQGTKFHYQALAVFIQIINHGIEHRTNVTTVLNQGQSPPPAVDGWGYLSAHPDRFDYEVS
jgi:uncharacterized damage-inducible protein DinB